MSEIENKDQLVNALLEDEDLRKCIKVCDRDKRTKSFVSEKYKSKEFRVRYSKNKVDDMRGGPYICKEDSYFCIKIKEDDNVYYYDLNSLKDGKSNSLESCGKKEEKCKIEDVNTFIEILKIIFDIPIKKNKTLNEILPILENSKQIILQGPPGTGKTRMAKILAYILTNTDKNSNSNNTDQAEFEKECLEASEKILRDTDGQIKLIQFHPSYGYEDFIMGVSVNTKDGNLVMEGKKGAIKDFADRIIEENKTNKKYVLIIDEINRAPIGTVMGELLYALEKRNEEIQIQSADDDNKTLRISDNLYIIGTMNTADKSLVSMDYAMRRRFAFININSCKPESDSNFDSELYSKVESLFSSEIIVNGINPDDIMLGISYFKNQDDDYKDYKIRYEIVPILREYYKDGYFKKNKKINEKPIKEIMKSNETLIEYLNPKRSEVKS